MTMQTISRYHRPSALDEAVALLGRDDVSTIVIGGGTVVVPADLPAGTEVVDIQTCVGDQIVLEGDRVVIGAMARLQDIVDHDVVPPLLAELAHREGPNTLRHASTVGGTVGTADPESELLAGLLVHDAEATIVSGEGPRTMALSTLFTDTSVLRRGIVTSVSVASGGETASARTGRTPADISIVAAAGRLVAGGVQIALTGVAATPVLVDPTNLAHLDPPGDFRGSSSYRKELAGVLVQRVVAQLGGVS